MILGFYVPIDETKHIVICSCINEKTMGVFLSTTVKNTMFMLSATLIQIVCNNSHYNFINNQHDILKTRSLYFIFM